MKKIFPAVTSVALASILVSCGTTTPVEPIPLSPKIETPAADVAPTVSTPTEATATGVTATGATAPVVTPEIMPTPAVDTPAVNPTPEVTGTGSMSGSISAKPEIKVTSQVVNYKSPAGDESIKVTIETLNGVILSVTSTPMATHEVSKKLQTSFSANIGVAVGKPVASLKLDAVGGASLTTKAFNEYVQSL